MCVVAYLHACQALIVMITHLTFICLFISHLMLVPEVPLSSSLYITYIIGLAHVCWAKPDILAWHINIINIYIYVYSVLDSFYSHDVMQIP